MDLSKYHLIYVPNDSNYSYVEGTMRAAQLLNKYTDKYTGEVLYDFLIITDSSGGVYTNPYAYIATENSIVSQRKIETIPDNASILQPLNSEKRLTASFYTKNDSKEEKSLSKTMNYPLGSGIYGWFIENEFPSDIIGEVAMAEIKISKPYLIQDKEHLNSIIQASNLTNIFLDKIKLLIPSSDFVNIRAGTVDKVLAKDLDELRRLHLLWSIALRRTGHGFDIKKFYQILYEYVIAYTGPDSYFGLSSYAFPLPINFIMLEGLGITGIILRKKDSNLYGTNSVSFKIDLKQTDVLITKNDF